MVNTLINKYLTWMKPTYVRRFEERENTSDTKCDVLE
jgi:hypothetical protein